MKKLIEQHHISFQHAIDGVRWAFTSQPNFRVHFFFSLTALLFAWLLPVSFIEICILIFTIVLGLTVEMVNTAIEAMTDLITQEWKKEAKIAKDVSAGMMLIVSIGAVVVAALIFLPKIIQIL